MSSVFERERDGDICSTCGMTLNNQAGGIHTSIDFGARPRCSFCKIELCHECGNPVRGEKPRVSIFTKAAQWIVWRVPLPVKSFVRDGEVNHWSKIWIYDARPHDSLPPSMLLKWLWFQVRRFLQGVLNRVPARQLCFKPSPPITPYNGGRHA